ncbi:sodium-dependent nutrient amino acid transporter 1 isoform X3 [Ochlerotatus camptorhynchus]|uniref:sodium-dependent nutrient amino acid transporter 1 isoform X3 n=1 Tax=Ochlerotatus camptorhynchus TaxID=644619 RepID=UPI0031DC7A7C
MTEITTISYPSSNKRYAVNVANGNTTERETESNESPTKNDTRNRPEWSNKLEFLMSCISMSVGLGNVWRFPFTAYENGGGAFLIPYLIVLFVIGRPLYYMEMTLGQFTSRSSVKIWEISPLFKGIGIGQLVGTASVVSYYVSLIAITLYYIFTSFASELPWAKCEESWGNTCVDSATIANGMKDKNISIGQSVSSSQIYFLDAMIVTTLDTFTSLLGGITIFSILGNLAHNLGIEDISKVVKSGTGLAFISYPDAIAKFDVVPQLFSVLFFFMLFVLGVGSAVALQSSIITAFWDSFPKQKYWHIALILSCVGFCTGLVYITPGGQWILDLVDHYGGTFLIYVLAIVEMIVIFWIYGLQDWCSDLEFMVQRRVGIYWRLCWGLITPLFMIAVFIYSLVEYKWPTYSGKQYPNDALICGIIVFAFGFSQVLIWATWTVTEDSTQTSLWTKITSAAKPSSQWGPSAEHTRKAWLKYKEESKNRREDIIYAKNHSSIVRKLYVLFGLYDDFIQLDNTRL